MKDLAVIWITRVSDHEDVFIQKGLDNLKNVDCQKIIVGHTKIQDDSVEYIPLFEHGLDALGLICHKKNIGILASRAKVSLVLHADMIPTEDILSSVQKINFKHGEFYAPVAYTGAGVQSLTWCRYAGQNKPVSEPECGSTYISGGAIISLTENFKEIKWDQSLRHNQEEDWDFAKRVRAKGWCNKVLPEINLIAANSQ